MNGTGPQTRDGRLWYSPGAPLRTDAAVLAEARRDPHSLFWAGGSRADLSPPPTPGLLDQFGRAVPRTDDPAFQPPPGPLDASIRARASVIQREIPITTTQTGYTVQEVRNAIAVMVSGQFDLSTQLADSVMADSRVAATLSSRTGGLLGRPVEFSIPPGYEDDEEAKLALRVWRHNWDAIFPESTASEFLRWVIMHGWGAGQNIWDTSRKWWIPTASTWYPRFMYYHLRLRVYVAITQDGQVPVTPGDGTWILHAPHGYYRGWMRGSLWSVAPWWLARNYCLRDWSRYSERHGMPILLAETPAAGDPAMVAGFRQDLESLGQESVVECPQGVEPQYSYGLKLVEATDQGWQGFLQLINACNTEITLAIMGQNLTTEIKEGSFAAARVHADVKQTFLEADARALERTVYTQIAQPFAAMNWGRPEIAPRTRWCVEPVEDNATRAEIFAKLAAGIFEFRRGGKKIRNLTKFVEQFGINMQLADVADAPPLQGKGGGGGGSGGGGGGGLGLRGRRRRYAA